MQRNYHIETLLGLRSFTIPMTVAEVQLINCDEKEIRIFDGESLGEAEIGAKTLQLQVGQKVDRDGDVVVLVLVGDHHAIRPDHKQLIALAKMVKGVGGLTVASLFDQGLNKSSKAYVVDLRSGEVRITSIKAARDFVRLDDSERGLYGLTDEGLIQFELTTLGLSGKTIRFSNYYNGFDPKDIHTVSRPISQGGMTTVFLNGSDDGYSGVITASPTDEHDRPHQQVLQIICKTALDNHTVYGCPIGDNSNVAFRDNLGALQHLGIDSFLATALPEQYQPERGLHTN